MALTEADIEQFIAELQANPQLRDRVRDAILAHDFLALPGIVERLGERIEQLALQDEQLGRRIDQLGQRVDELGQRVDQLGQRVDQLGQRVDQLGQRVDQLAIQMQQLGLKLDRFEGRLGNVEGRQFESEYRDNLTAHLARSLRNVRRVVPAELPEMAQAYESGRVSHEDWADVHRIDVLAVGRPWQSDPDAPEKLLAIELSLVVDRSDVERAARRANVLRREGLSAEPAVDGEAITADAQQLAQELDVTVLVRKVQPAA